MRAPELVLRPLGLDDALVELAVDRAAVLFIRPSGVRATATVSHEAAAVVTGRSHRVPGARVTGNVAAGAAVAGAGSTVGQAHRGRSDGDHHGVNRDPVPGCPHSGLVCTFGAAASNGDPPYSTSGIPSARS